ncbi:MAG: hypothetical protein RBT61_12255 [Candidatus Kapabacteria bacterium]|nr:hypothetical protein [Candidatus Kapabacteria bacterium]
MKKNHKYYCSIDVGTNSIHSIIAYVDLKNNLRTVFKHKESIRLGKSMSNKRIPTQLIDTAADTISKIKKSAEKFDAEIHAVATSAVREAVNKDEFVDRILTKTGVKINVINGNEEGELIYEGVVSGLKLNDDDFLIIDIGGGSTELISANSSDRNVYSLGMGAIRTSMQFFPKFEIESKSLENCLNHLDNISEQAIKEINIAKFKNVIGTSGTIQALGRMIIAQNGGHSKQFIVDEEFSASDFMEVIDKILSISKPSERIMLPGLEKNRADIIVAGAVILKFLINRLNIKKIRVTTFSLRE